jgi:hypothetical protein
MSNPKHLRVVIWALFAVTVGSFAAYCWLYNEPFTKEKWNNATPEMRDRLLLSLSRTGILFGLTEQEVYDMLGPPDGSSGGRMVYNLGSPSDSSCPPAALVLEFTTDDIMRGQDLSCMGKSQRNDKFSPDAWRSGTSDEKYSMVRDLIASQVLLGLKRQQAIEVLGPPDKNLPTDPTIKVWYTRRYRQGGEIKKRIAGASRCLYIHIRDGTVEKAEFVGS